MLRACIFFLLSSPAHSLIPSTDADGTNDDMAIVDWLLAKVLLSLPFTQLWGMVGRGDVGPIIR